MHNLRTVALAPSVQALIDSLAQSCQTGNLNPKSVAKMVADAHIKAEDLAPFYDFEHPATDCYGRKLVHDGGEFEVMVMSWNPNHFSSIHNHGYTQWGAVQTFGYAHHAYFGFIDGRLEMTRREVLPPEGVVKVNNALIHQMGNPTTDRFVSLHVYGANEYEGEDDVTADARQYELEHNRIVHTTGGAFFNLPESDIYDIEPFTAYSSEVFFLYARQLLDYYNRQKTSPRIDSLKRNLLEKMARFSNLN